MKKLFLASSGLSALPDFVGTDPAELSMLFVSTAGNLDENTWWIEKDREVLIAMGFNLYDIDIAVSDRSELNEQLMTSDIVYITDGNAFYLLQQLRKSGFAKLLTDFVNNGGLYAGAGAGALVAGADISPIASLDQPDKVFGLKSTLGLQFVNIIPIPHYTRADLSTAIDLITAAYAGEAEIVLLTDDQAIIVEDTQWKQVDSTRNQLERDWFESAQL
jgi:dipeptidase E